MAQAKQRRDEIAALKTTKGPKIRLRLSRKFRRVREDRVYHFKNCAAKAAALRDYPEELVGIYNSDQLTALIKAGKLPAKYVNAVPVVVQTFSEIPMGARRSNTRPPRAMAAPPVKKTSDRGRKKAELRQQTKAEIHLEQLVRSHPDKSHRWYFGKIMHLMNGDIDHEWLESMISSTLGHHQFKEAA